VTSLSRWTGQGHGNRACAWNTTLQTPENGHVRGVVYWFWSIQANAQINGAQDAAVVPKCIKKFFLNSLPSCATIFVISMNIPHWINENM
jgi:hypothetical protein